MAPGLNPKILMAVKAGAMATGAYFVVTGGISLALMHSGPAAFSGNSVAIDGLTYRPASLVTAQFQRLTLEGSSMSAPEVVALFSPGPLATSAREAFGRLTAEKIMTPELKLAFPLGTLTLRDFVVTHVHNGLAARIGVSGGDLTLKAGGADLAAFKLGALSFGDADAGYAYGAVRSGSVRGEAFRYGALQFEGMKGDLSVPGTQGLQRATVEFGEVKAANIYDGELPRRTSAAVGSILVTPTAGILISAFAAAGIEVLDVGGGFYANYDWPQRRMTLEEVSLTLKDLGAVTVKGVFVNADKAIMATDPDTRAAAILAMTLESATLRFTNTGLVNKLLEMGSRLQNKPVEAVRAEALAAINKTLLGNNSRLQDGPAMAAFASDPRSLTISIKPKPGTTPVSFDKMNGQWRELSRFEMEMRAND